jgi:hypothetical protein
MAFIVVYIIKNVDVNFCQIFEGVEDGIKARTDHIRYDHMI